MFAAPKKPENKLYDIEIVDEDGPNVNVHYVEKGIIYCRISQLHEEET